MQTLSDWIAHTNQLFKDEYAITIEDLGLTNAEISQFWRSGERPADYVKRLGEKYDLIRLRHWSGENYPLKTDSRWNFR